MTAFLASHIGSGVGFPLKTGLSGNLNLSAEGQNLEESIHLILRTSLGERVYRPDFGSRLSELVFAPLNTSTLLLLRLYVEEALEAWEPRIELDEIVTDPDPIQGRVDITIHYHPTDTHDFRSLVYPFYLVPAVVEGV
jgi:uncharacterized protein